MAAATVFSEYELRKMAIRFDNESTAVEASCVGSCSEELDVRKVTKKCRGITVKTRVKGSGTGKLTISMHVPKDVYDGMFGMKLDGLIDGVRAYGQSSTHPEFCITQEVYDEDGNKKFKAYPRCIMESGVSRSIENGTEEVKEVDLDISIMPDEHGMGMYEVLDSELKEETVRTNWMSKFDPETMYSSIPKV
ncbi:MAG: hypothetical protein ACLUD0_08865 [Eubacterium ramulus]